MLVAVLVLPIAGLVPFASGYPASAPIKQTIPTAMQANSPWEHPFEKRVGGKPTPESANPASGLLSSSSPSNALNLGASLSKQSLKEHSGKTGKDVVESSTGGASKVVEQTPDLGTYKQLKTKPESEEIKQEAGTSNGCTGSGCKVAQSIAKKVTSGVCTYCKEWHKALNAHEPGVIVWSKTGQRYYKSEKKNP